MPRKDDFLDRLQFAVEQLHNCCATHAGTFPVSQKSRGRIVWAGDVEVFDLFGHPKAQRCYAWFETNKSANGKERFISLLEIPPVDSPQKAVEVQMAKAVRRAQRKK